MNHVGKPKLGNLTDQKRIEQYTSNYEGTKSGGSAD